MFIDILQWGSLRADFKALKSDVLFYQETENRHALGVAYFCPLPAGQLQSGEQWPTEWCGTYFFAFVGPHVTEKSCFVLQSGMFILSGTSKVHPVKRSESFCSKKIKSIRNFQYFQKLNCSLKTYQNIWVSSVCQKVLRYLRHYKLTFKSF